MYRFKLPVGDWSSDGHCECEYYLVSSNKPVEEVREAHYKIKEKTGIDIETECAEYQDNILSLSCKEKLSELGFALEEAGTETTPEEMARIWLFLLQKADSELELQLVPEDKSPCLCFYGFDAQGRHISGVGYGLFR